MEVPIIVFLKTFVKRKPVFTGITIGIAGLVLVPLVVVDSVAALVVVDQEKAQNVSGHCWGLSSPLTNTADGSTTGSTDLQTWIRAASGVDYVIPNSGNYGMQAL